MNIFSLYFKHTEGGFTRRLYSLYKNLAQEGHSLYYFSSEKLPVAHENIVPCIIPSSHKVRNRGIFWVYFIICSFLKSNKIAKDHEIQRIITFSPFYTFLCLFPIVFKQMPAITFLRADNMRHSNNSLRNFFFYIADGFGIKISRKVVFNSFVLKKVYQKRYHIPEHKVYILPNNIGKKFHIDKEEKRNIRTSFDIDSKEFVISTAGTFNEGKNFGYLIRSMGTLYREGIKLLIIGDEVVPNGEKRRLKMLVNQLGLDNFVIFSGWKDNPAPFIASSDLFVFPSRFEGSPNALLEALGCNVPCLGARIDEVAEILCYDDLLFPLDCKEILTDKIMRIKRDPLYYKRIKMLSEKCCDRYCFDWGQAVLRLVA